MTPYWITLAALAYLLWMAQSLDPTLDSRPTGQFPTATSSRLFLGATAAILMVVAALRWRVGTDFMAYINNYDLYKDTFLDDLKSFDEPGIKGLALAVSFVRDDPKVFVAVAAAITIGMMLGVITRYSVAIGMSYLLFVFVGAWHGTFNGVRQYFAAAIILAGHRFIVNKKFIGFAVIVALAASFHISALAMALLFLVPNRQLGPRMILLLAGSAVALLYASDAVLEAAEFVKEDLTITSYVTTGINPLRIAVAVAPVLFYWTRGVRTEADGEWFYRNMAIVHGAVMFAVSWSAYLGRFGIYTTVFLPLVIPRLIDLPDRRLTAFLRAGIILLYAAYWYVEVSGSAALRDFKFIEMGSSRG